MHFEWLNELNVKFHGHKYSFRCLLIELSSQRVKNKLAECENRASFTDEGKKRVWSETCSQNMHNLKKPQFWL